MFVFDQIYDTLCSLYCSNDSTMPPGLRSQVSDPGPPGLYNHMKYTKHESCVFGTGFIFYRFLAIVTRMSNTQTTQVVYKEDLT